MVNEAGLPAELATKLEARRNATAIPMAAALRTESDGGHEAVYVLGSRTTQNSCRPK